MMMKIVFKFVSGLLLFTSALTSCMSLAHMEYGAAGNTVQIRQLGKKERQSDSDSTALPSSVSFVDAQGKRQFLLSNEKDALSGEDIASVQLDGITVVSRSRSLPERNGMVNVSMAIHVPEVLCSSETRLWLTPVLLKSDSSLSLPPVRLNGSALTRYRLREKSWLEKASCSTLARRERELQRLSFFGKDSLMFLTSEKMFHSSEEMNVVPLLDSIISLHKGFDYHYSFSWPVNELESRFRMTMEARVELLSRREVLLPPSDTLTFLVSSLVQLTDSSLVYRKIGSSVVRDAEYASAFSMLQDHQYKQALPVLQRYGDVNTVICLLSMGYDLHAYELLKGLDVRNADVLYLMSLACCRLNRNEEAVNCFIESCRMDESKLFRGELDSEIAALIRTYHLDKIIYNY